MKTLDQFNDKELSENVLDALQDVAGDEILSSSDIPAHTLKPTKQDVLNLFLRGNRLDWNYYTNYGIECSDARIDSLLMEIYMVFDDANYIANVTQFDSSQEILFHYIIEKFALLEESQLVAKLQHLITGSTQNTLEGRYIN